jgi:MFS family permease
MATSLLEHETVNISLEDVVRARPSSASPVTQSRSTTAALAFLIGCVSLMMTGFAVILPVFPQRLQALGLGSEMLAFINVPLLFIPIRFVEGMLLSGLIPVAMSMVGDTIPLSKQGRWIGFLTTAQPGVRQKLKTEEIGLY